MAEIRTKPYMLYFFSFFPAIKIKLTPIRHIRTASDMEEFLPMQGNALVIPVIPGTVKKIYIKNKIFFTLNSFFLDKGTEIGRYALRRAKPVPPDNDRNIIVLFQIVIQIHQ